MKNKSLVPITDLSKEQYFKILDLAEEFAKKPKQNLIQDYVVATLFFEPSTRTRLSFETAICQLGGKYIGFTDPNVSSVRKGESLKDTIQTVANYSDLIIMRHPVDGAARYASEVSKSSHHQCRRWCKPASNTNTTGSLYHQGNSKNTHRTKYRICW